MISTLVTVCDALIADLQGFVSGLGTIDPSRVHRYAPWNPEELLADGYRHLAVWPVGDAETGEDYVNLAREFVEHYDVLVWEPAGTEASRAVEDEAGAKAFLELQADVLERFLLPAQSAGGAYLARYVSTTFPESPGISRWFRSRIDCRRYHPLA